MTTISATDCMVTTPPPYSATFDGGPATNGSCASVQAQFPGDTVTATPIVSTTQAPPVTTTTTATQPVDGSPGACSPSGFAGCSGNGLNGGAGTGGCYVGCTPPSVPIAAPPSTGVPVTTVPVPAVPVAVPLAFTGADLAFTAGLGLAAVLVGLLLWRATRRRVTS